MNAGVDVMVGRAAELWAKRGDELRWKMKALYEFVNSDVHSKSADARPVSVIRTLGALMTLEYLSQ